MKYALRFISECNYEIGGHLIDIRDGLVYISLVGMDATDEQREYFIKVDKKMEFRKRLWLQLKERSPSGLTIVYGGEVGLSIYPSEWDKIQILQYIKGYNNIFYFGDRYEENGNDYKIINHKDVIGNKVNNISDTEAILTSYIRLT